MTATRRPPSLIGLALIVIGIILLLETTALADLGDWYRWLPIVLVLAGGLQLYANGFRAPLGPLLLMAAGVVLLLATLGVMPWETLGALWPLILIVFGASILWGRRSTGGDGADSVDRMTATALLGGTERRIASQAFKGGDATAVLGGVDIDLRDAAVPERPATINVNVLMGGVDIKVPEEWTVDMRATAILGGADDERRRQGVLLEGEQPHLIVTGLVLLGGVTVKT